MAENKPKSRERAAVFIKAAFEALDEAGGSLRFREVLKEVENRVELSDHDRHVYPKSGYTRWKSVLHFHSIDCVKAGFIKKEKGRWYLTPEGRNVLSLPGEEILRQAIEGYKKWRAEQPDNRIGEEEGSAERSFVYEQAESDAKSEIEDYIADLGPYEFQDMVAALLRAMGYHTPFTAPKGPDGGTDILAYPDPLGTDTPHIRVQVKHRLNSGSKVGREEVAALRGVIRQGREIGLYVSSAGFTNEAAKEASTGSVHIELIDLDKFLDLWMENYDNIEEANRALLRLRAIYFLAPE